MLSLAFDLGLYGMAGFVRSISAATPLRALPLFLIHSTMDAFSSTSSQAIVPR
jgi:hypothetical protein